MSSIVNETIVRDFYQLYMARNREGFAALMHPEFYFTSPKDNHIDKAAYFARCWTPGDLMRDFTITQMAVTNQFVFVNYTITMKDETTHFENVELFTIEDDKVREVRVYFGNPQKHHENQSRAA